MNPFLSKTQMTQLWFVVSISMLIYYNSIYRWHQDITRSGILTPNNSPRYQVHEISDDGSFFNLTDFSREACEEMHYYNYYCIKIIWKDIVLVVLDCSTVITNEGLSCFSDIVWLWDNCVLSLYNIRFLFITDFLDQ